MPANKKRAVRRAEKFRGWLLLDGKNRLLYRKEVIYEGDWGKLNSRGDGIAFAIARDTLSHWQQSLAEMRAAGIKSPFTTSHENWESTEDRLGEVINAEVSENDNGKPSLYLDILFDDEKSRDIGLKGDVSIGSPPVWYDGRKRKWVYPLQHVASTNAPVIPGLETWQAIAAAFGERKSNKGSIMDLEMLIELMGLTDAAATAESDDEKIGLIKAKIAEWTGGTPKPDAEGNPKPAAVAASQSTPAPASAATSAVPQAKKVTVAFSHAHPVLVKTVRDARVATLDALVAQNVISPAIKKELVLSHCTDDGIKLELSHAADDSAGGAAFDEAIKLVKLVAKDRPLKSSGRSAAGEQTDDQVLELSHGLEANSFEKSCENRAKEMAGV